MAEQVFYIVNWPWHEHREMPRKVRWCKMRAGIETDDARDLLAHPHGVEGWALYHVLLGLAAVSPFRGLILKSGNLVRPHTAETIAELCRWDVAVVMHGLSALNDVTNWLGSVPFTARPDTISRRLWSQVFCVSGLVCAKKSRKRRGKTALTITLTSQSQGSELNPPLPPKAPGRRPEAGGENDGNGGEIDESWGNGSWEVIGTLAGKDLVNKLWLPHLKQRTADLTAWPMKDVLGHLVDLHRARDKAKSLDDVFKRLFWRLREGKAPSMRNRRVVEKFMRFGG